jgi:hypothetical protein
MVGVASFAVTVLLMRPFVRSATLPKNVSGTFDKKVGERCRSE